MKKPEEQKEQVPMTWISERHPLWEELWSRWESDPDRANYKGERPPAIFSKHVKPEEGPGWFFRTSWVVDIRSAQLNGQPGGNPSALPKIRNELRKSAAKHPASGPEPWLPLTSRRSETISAMERRWDAGKVNRHEYETYAGTLRATAALLGKDDPDRGRCLALALRVEDQARLSDDAFVRKAMGWF